LPHGALQRPGRQCAPAQALRRRGRLGRRLAGVGLPVSHLLIGWPSRPKY